MTSLLDRLNAEFPGFIVKADGTPFRRPDWTGDRQVYRTGWYWRNIDGDRFYFETAEACAEDAALSLGVPFEEPQGGPAKSL